jgi:hypothetical protein
MDANLKPETSNPKPFAPAWWCRGAHAQTLWPYLFRPSPRVELHRERLELPDGDFLDLDWTTGRDGPIVLILHGLDGSSNSKYARGLLKSIHARRWRGVVMHFRGCSGEPNRLPRSYHSGETGDLAHVLSVLRRREPETPLAAVGYSLGGNVLLKWLGETANAPILKAGRTSAASRASESARGPADAQDARMPRRPVMAGSGLDPIGEAATAPSLARGPRLDPIGETGATLLRAAVAVSVPFRLGESAERLEHGLSRVYQLSLLRRLRKSVQLKQQRMSLPLRTTNLSALKTFRQFDDHVTAPLHGFDDAEHYYRVSSCRQYLSGIRLPTLILHSLDDPFMTPDSPPCPEELSPSTVLELYASGGHVGFVGGSWPWKARYWLEERIPSYLHPLIATREPPSPVTSHDV